MKSLIQRIIQMIENQIEENTANLIKLENFESPFIYQEICDYFSKLKPIVRNETSISVDMFTALIDVRKYQDFKNSPKNSDRIWTSALEYLAENGYHNEAMPLTAMRNKAAEQIDRTTIFLLMGAETAEDKGSLSDFHRISSGDIVASLKKDYSKWFDDTLVSLDANKSENYAVLKNIFKAVFKKQNIDIMTFSKFIDDIDHQTFENFEELVSYIFETLKFYWEIPSVLTNLPKISAMKGNKSIAIIENAYLFIHNLLPFSNSKLKKLHEQLQKYADETELDVTQPFGSFQNYAQFSEHLISFLNKQEMNQNRQLFMEMDFGIISKILKLKIVSNPENDKPKEETAKLFGDPLEVYLKSIIFALVQFYQKYETQPTELIFDIKKIKLSNCISEENADNAMQEHFRNICNYLGGILEFIKQKCLRSTGLNIRYETEADPFMYQNSDLLKGRIQKIEKWGENSQITFVIRTIGNTASIEKKSEIHWYFSPYASWKNAFSLFIKAYEANSESYELPYIIQCKNMQDFLSCESEEEFNIKLETMQYEAISQKFECEIRKYFGNSEIFEKWNGFVNRFTTWCEEMAKKGFFYCIDQMNAMINDYCNILEFLRISYNTMTSSMKGKLGLFLNCFTIVSDMQYLKTMKSDAVIVPTYHPGMLEKLNARNDYLVYSFSDLLDNLDSLMQNKNYKKIYQVLDQMNALAAITQAMDVIPDGSGDYLLCKNIWGYYAVYGNHETASDYISNIECIQEVYEETAQPETAESPQSHIVTNHILDFLKTFPSCCDGLNICFVAPAEIQDIVAGIEKAAERLDKSGIHAVFYVRILCLGGSKNIGGYLRYWLDNYSNQEKRVEIHTYLKYLQESDIKSDIKKLLKHQDICFIYDILKTNQISFDSYSFDVNLQRQNMTSCQFPMTFVPDTLSSTHGEVRKVNISQIQFLVSDAYTQTVYRITNPNAIQNQYKVMQVLALEDNQSNLLNTAHNECRWVICIDKAIDRDLLQNHGNRIIGFTTGEGCFGEYNVTVSAKEEILADIKKILKYRLIEKFSDWKTDRIEMAADYCIEMTRHFDGSRILKALNPYDYEIHNFLAYVLTVKSLGITPELKESKLLAQTLLNLDSYHHWMDDAENRPDFMLLELPDIPENRKEGEPLHIRIKIIECKMSSFIENHIEKAVKQVSVGIATLSDLWNPNNKKVDRRYWYTQLYRAIAFSKLKISDGDADYPVINAKIYDVLNGNFIIDWTGDIYAYDLASDSTACIEEELETDCGIDNITLHRPGQLYIQKMLLPEECDSEIFTFHNLLEEQEATVESQEEDNKPEISDLSATNEEISSQPDISSNHTEEMIMEELPNISQPEQKKPLSEIRVLLGEDKKTGQKYYWEFGNKQLNNRHLLINGNSGYGKTYCIQALLMELSVQGVPSIIFDYTGGFAPDKLDSVFRQELGNKIEQRIVKIKKIPINPFARGSITLMEGVVIPEENADIANKISNVLTAAYKFGEQQRATVYTAIMNGLQEYDEKMSFEHLYELIGRENNNYSESVLNKMRPFIDLNPFAADDTFTWQHIKDSDGMAYVVQLIGYDRPTQLMLTELLLWDFWNFMQSNGRENEPVVVVLDEAQNLNHQSSSPSGKILTEGRKFGISGWYATQFMKGQLKEDEIQCLQQASQKLYFCPPENGVMEVAKNIASDRSEQNDWAAKLKKLRKGECVTCGSMVRGESLSKYPPRTIHITSLQERIAYESMDRNQT